MNNVHFEVLPGKKIAGRQRIYREGDIFPVSQAIGDMDAAVKNKKVKKIVGDDVPVKDNLNGEIKALRAKNKELSAQNETLLTEVEKLNSDLTKLTKPDNSGGGK